ncbi:MAG: tetratricopeptide repeat protein, partial [Bryobacteraceae bacterium]
MFLGKPGEVITFYSYSGGVGRSMALANIGCLLARRCGQGHGVLMVDWNLEAPGLHSFFTDGLLKQFSASPDPARCAREQPGLIDLFCVLDQAIGRTPADEGSADEIFGAIDLEQYELDTGSPSLRLLKAGRFDGDYSYLASSFDWPGLHDRAPWLMGALMARLTAKYRYVLIDSRSGVNEMSGLCTMMLPDKLVAAFTPSRQSIDGLLDVLRCAADYRKGPGASPLSIFPLPSKVDFSEPDLRSSWRFGDRDEGYQPAFETLFRELTGAPECRLGAYFSQVQIPYSPRFAFGENTPAADTGPERSTLVRGYARLADRLALSWMPWESTAAPEREAVIVDGAPVSASIAEKSCIEAIAKYRAAGDLPSVAAVLRTLAAWKEREGQWTEAGAHYLEAVELCKREMDRAGFAASVSGLARLERLAGRLEQARIYYLEAGNLQREDGAMVLLAETLAVLGDLESKLNETETARQHYGEAISLHKQQGDFSAAAQAVEGLGDLERQLGNRTEASAHYVEAVAMLRSEREEPALARVLVSLASVKMRADILGEAENHYLEAGSLYRKLENRRGLAYSLSGLAAVRRRLKKTAEAVIHYAEALSLYRLEEDQLAAANTLQHLGDLEVRAGKAATAAEHYEEAMVLYRREGNNLGVANTLRSLGDLDRRYGKFEQARQRYQEAMEIYRSENNSLGHANCLQGLGDLEKRHNQLEAAARHYEQAIQIYRNEKANVGLANALKSLGDVECESGSMRLAQDHYEQAI